jgi:N-methylhydantoinase A
VAQGTAKPSPQAIRATKPVYFRATGWVNTLVYTREHLRAGNVIAGPALIEEHASTTVVQPGDTLSMDELGNLQIAIGSERT